MRDPTELPFLEPVRETGVPPSPGVGRLIRRADFVRVGKGKRWHGKAMTVQVAASDEPAVRVGFTLTRKVGNAVVRNRARRRLREALRLSPSLSVQAGHDYVIVGRIDAIRLPFELLKTELSRAIGAVHGEGRGGSRRSGSGRGRNPG